MEKIIGGIDVKSRVINAGSCNIVVGGSADYGIRRDYIEALSRGVEVDHDDIEKLVEKYGLRDCLMIPIIDILRTLGVSIEKKTKYNPIYLELMVQSFNDVTWIEQPVLPVFSYPVWTPSDVNGFITYMNLLEEYYINITSDLVAIHKAIKQ
jgi:hypothetical protein